MISKKVWVTFNVVGFHQWKGAPKEVSYLRSSHRHVFKFKVCLSVPHGNRAIEFHTAKGVLLSGIADIFSSTGSDVQSAYDFGGMSCEQIAEKLCCSLQGPLYNLKGECIAGDETFDLTYLDPKARQYEYISVEVSEDGENGAIVEYTRDEVKT